MKRKHLATLEKIYVRPASGSIRWIDVENLFRELGAEISEREVRGWAFSCLERSVSSIVRTLLRIPTRVLSPASENGWRAMELNHEEHSGN
jgi:hypothetical protein